MAQMNRFWKKPLLLDCRAPLSFASPLIFSAAFCNLLCERIDTMMRNKTAHNAQESALNAPMTVNGVDVAALSQTLDAMKCEPALGAFQFRAGNTWLGGGLNRSVIAGFYGAGRERPREKPFSLSADEPPVLLGGDKGANPVEFVLHALAACLTTSLVYHAAARGISIKTVSSEVEGDIDVRGFMGLADDVRKGYHHVRVKMRVASDAPAEQLEALAKFSPVFDIVSNSLPVALTVETHR
jgi:uncharacterized OsmC-like protein